MEDSYIGEIRIFAGNYAPVGWALCNGDYLPIEGNEVLFALIGDTYGKSNPRGFKLPDLRGRLPIHFGKGAGLTERTLGETGGAETAVLTVENIPRHTHSPRASSDTGNSDSVAGNFWAKSSRTTQFNLAETINVKMSPLTLAATGKNAAHDNMLPFLPLNFIIALTGSKPIK